MGCSIPLPWYQEVPVCELLPYTCEVETPGMTPPGHKITWFEYRNWAFFVLPNHSLTTYIIILIQINIEWRHELWSNNIYHLLGDFYMSVCASGSFNSCLDIDEDFLSRCLEQESGSQAGNDASWDISKNKLPEDLVERFEQFHSEEAHILKTVAPSTTAAANLCTASMSASNVCTTALNSDPSIKRASAEPSEVGSPIQRRLSELRWWVAFECPTSVQCRFHL